MLGFQVLLAGLCLLLGSGQALQVSPGSPCAAVCLNDPEADSQDPSSSTTETSEIVCQNDEFSSQLAGIKLQNCMQCLQKSNATSHGESDSQWFIYNARFTVDVCMFGFKNESKRVSSPCDVGQSCKSLKAALLVGNLDSTRDIYEYCDADGGSFSGNKMDACTQCYSNTDTTSHLSNFLIALKAGCQQRPHDGAVLGLSQSVFASSAAEITNPSSDSALLSNPKNSNAMTTGAIVGIAVGGALLLFGGIGLFFVYQRKQKQLYNSNHYADFDFQNGPGRGRKSSSPQPLLVGGHAGSGRSSASTPDVKIIGSSIYAARSVANLAEYELASKGHRYHHPHMRTDSSNSQYQTELEKEMQIGTTKLKPMPPMSRIQTYTNSSSSRPEQVAAQVPYSHAAYVPQAHSRQSSLAGPGTALLSGSAPITLSSSYPHDPADTSCLHGLTPPRYSVFKHDSTSSMSSTASAARAPHTADQHQPQVQAGPGQEGQYHPSRWPSPDRNPYRASMGGSNRPAPSVPTGASAQPAANPAIAKLIQTTARPQQVTTTTTTTTALPSGIPPPPPGSKAPDLAMPSVPRIRVPKTYVPPSITVEEATPVERMA